MKLIDKDALVAEINHWIKDARRRYTMSLVQFSLSDRIELLESLLSFLDNLEVKEVDINKEISQFIDANFEKATIGHKLSLRRVAKHFYELGLKAKGE